MLTTHCTVQYFFFNKNKGSVVQRGKPTPTPELRNPANLANSKGVIWHGENCWYNVDRQGSGGYRNSYLTQKHRLVGQLDSRRCGIQGETTTSDELTRMENEWKVPHNEQREKKQ